ncbi:hypothetical protein MJ585_11480 [Klebsiella pneumoniae]|nr:hypothetical protein MJ585_11480 [Klebsiella pneumoniae]
MSANGEREPGQRSSVLSFQLQEDAQILEKEYGIPRRYLGTIMLWAQNARMNLVAEYHQVPGGKGLAVNSANNVNAKTEPEMRTTRHLRRWLASSYS